MNKIKINRFSIIVIIFLVIFFSIFSNIGKTTVDGKEKLVIIFVDDNYSQIKEEIQRYKTDIEEDLLSEVWINVENWENGLEIRSYLKSLYKNYSLIGAILIGEIPTMWFSPEIDITHDETWPSDYLYMDLKSDYTLDKNGYVNYISKTHYDDFKKRDIWVGRIKPPNSTGEYISLLKDYFDRNHKYRHGELEFTEKILYYPYMYIEKQDLQEEECQKSYENYIVENTAYTSDDILTICSINNDGVSTYVDELSRNREWVIVNAHGTTTTQYLRLPINRYQIQPAQPNALCYSLLSCSNGNFTSDNYLGGWYLFSGNGLVAYAYSAETPMEQTEWLQYALPLQAGLSFGEVILYDDNEALTILGDPTLKMRQKEKHNFPKVVLEKTNISFGKVKINETKKIDINVINTGYTDFVLSTTYSFQKSNYPSRHNIYGNSYSYNIMPFSIDSKKISPESSAQLSFLFTPRVEGKYSLNWTVLTNDPMNPFLTFYLEGFGTKEKIKNQKPVVVINSPTSGDTVSNTITISGLASDTDGNDTLKKVEIKIDDGKWITTNGTSNWNYQWDTTKIEDGEHIIYARAYDGTNYSNQKLCKIFVFNRENEKKEEKPESDLLIILFAIAALALLLLLNRKIL